MRIKHLLLLFAVIFSLPCFPQDEPAPSDADRQADSILKDYFQYRDINPENVPGIDSARLEEAEEEFMKDYLKLERHAGREKVQKRILQVTIGLFFLIALIIGLRRRIVVRRDNRPPGM